ncbi:MAG: SpoIIIAH-like family protein [Clostridiales bacterium]|nr:SpoIIIAH-like family protein [Candidatus Equinaster intestinalis]
MKKGKVLGKGQILLAVMVVALGLAVWFNMRYSDTAETGKYLGEAQYVDTTSGEAVETSAKTDYFSTAKKERDDAFEQASGKLQTAIKTAGGNTEAVKEAADKAASLTSRKTAEANIESLLKAKGFSEALAVIGDNDINIVVRGSSLTAAQTLQIQDIAAAQSGYTSDKIKILTVQ